MMNILVWKYKRVVEKGDCAHTGKDIVNAKVIPRRISNAIVATFMN